MTTLLGYARMAEQHWWEHCPNLVRRLEKENRLNEALAEAQRQTMDEMELLMRQLRKSGLTSAQAHDQAWEMVREKYLLLPAEAG
jgi:hypothetical protein